MNNEFSYEGRDLETMAILLRYYRWILEMFSPYLSGHAVEFGAGQGTISEILLPRIDKLDLIEPSANLFEVLRQKFDGNERIALFDEYTIRGNKFVAQQTESSLRRWQKPFVARSVAPTAEQSRLIAV